MTGNPYRLLLLSLLLLLPFIHSAQQSLVLPADPGERLDLWTDRAFYCVDEELYYAVGHKEPDGLENWPWSRLVYIELVSWSGQAHVSVKSVLEDGSVTGRLRIPADLPSGGYYLRTYTRWMRNYSPNSYTYFPIRIINPFSAKVEAGPEALSAPIGELPLDGGVREDGLLFEGLKSLYAPGKDVSFRLVADDGIPKGSYVLSIARELPGDPGPRQFETAASSKADKPVRFFPEVAGASLSGHVECPDQASVKGLRVSLSSYSGDFYFSTSTTDESGAFSFLLPEYTGNHEFHISVEDRDDAGVYIHSEFCTRELNLPFVHFELSEVEKDAVQEMAINAQLRSRFRSKYEEADSLPSFYGNPDVTFKQEDYIELDELREFFQEIVYNVQTGSYRGEPFLKVTRPSSLIAFPSLVLLDNVPVKNIRALLQLPSRLIDRIEVIEQGYILGNEKYHGIISIYSKNRDVVGDEITGTSHFFPYQLYQRNGESGGADPNGVRDQNLLLWEPGLLLGAGEDKTIEFRTPDLPGTYRVTLRKLDAAAKVSRMHTARFSVE